MATTATPTLVGGMGLAPGSELFEAMFTLLYDTTDASGLMTIDLTSYFSQVASISVGGSTATTGYFTDTQHAGLGTATTSTNCKVGIYEAGADAAALDPVGSTDMSSVITNQVIIVKGKQAIS